MFLNSHRRRNISPRIAAGQEANTPAGFTDHPDRRQWLMFAFASRFAPGRDSPTGPNVCAAQQETRPKHIPTDNKTPVQTSVSITSRATPSRPCFVGTHRDASMKNTRACASSDLRPNTLTREEKQPVAGCGSVCCALYGHGKRCTSLMI